MKRGKLAEAEAEIREGLAITRRLYGEEHNMVAFCLGELALVLQARGNPAEAEEFSRRAVTLQRKLQGKENLLVGRELVKRASIQSAQGDLAGAIATRREALAAIRNQTGKAHPFVVEPLMELAADLSTHGEFIEAEGLLAEAWKIEKSFNYFRITSQRRLHENFAELYTAWAKADPAKATRAAEWQKKCDDFNVEMAKRNGS